MFVDAAASAHETKRTPSPWRISHYTHKASEERFCYLYRRTFQREKEGIATNAEFVVFNRIEIIKVIRKSVVTATVTAVINCNQQIDMVTTMRINSETRISKAKVRAFTLCK